MTSRQGSSGPANYNAERDALKGSFNAGRLATAEAREAVLASIVKMFEENVEEATAALMADLGRPMGEAQGECMVIIREAKDISAKIKTWMAAERKDVHLLVLPAEAAVRRSPFGTVLIVAPYNYPLVLLFEPLIGAIAAGNTAMVKPSELTPASAEFLARKMPKYISPDVCRVVTGGVDVSTALLATKWDFIYFTGSPRVGQIVAKAAAEHMTPTALELGGKAPCLIHQSAPLRESARRIINTKAINAGQTCMAPDYLLVHEAHHADFLAALQAEMKEQFGDEPIRSKDFGRMCTTSHYDRMVELLAKAGGKQIRIGAAGPDRATKYMPLTLVDGPTVGSPILKEEIFGPLLPVLTYTSLAEAVKLIQSIDPTPLALYVFSADETVAETLLSEVQSGTVVVNDCYLHHICHTLPFGGVGTSGYGVCHGRYSFETFTYQRAVLWRNATLDIDMTIPLPVRHCSAADKWMLRPKLLSLLLLYGPYVSIPRRRHLVLALVAIVSLFLHRKYSAIV